MRKSKYLSFGINIKLIPKIAEYQKRKFPDESSMFHELPVGTQMNLTLEELIHDAERLRELEKEEEYLISKDASNE